MPTQSRPSSSFAISMTTSRSLDRAYFIAKDAMPTVKLLVRGTSASTKRSQA